MPLVRKRRAPAEQPAEESSSPEPTSTQRPKPRQRRPPSDSDADDASDTNDDSTPAGTQAHRNLDVMVKKLVRLALACEYSRQVIRRTDVREKVLGDHGARQFKAVFDGAQRELREKFGMRMVEQPLKEKVTISQRRAAQRSDRPSTTSKTWTLTTTLPPAYRHPTILPPTRASSTTTESTYTALYTFIISTIQLSGGRIPEQKLDRYLRRVNAENYTPIDRTDRLLARMCKEGYLVKNREMDGGEEVVEYLVGPRGRVEVGVAGVMGVVREVYGYGEEGEGEGEGDREDFEKKLKRSLGVREGRGFGGEGEGEGDGEEG
ncbi:hypothetical protein FQN55_000562 [Onygenales sp. PD_40]|nr:hypothetical protein FQN55_000562 [Onygenales sp. PD_40]KAK2786561.1 hypothetical protein FQN53_006496 [Emmonsiellopsis sp. PD_33]KAK2786790.1 hypothetical protein FQN52_007677 [Onygenales sp. PD_12]KAK2798157.1 hypothetical protein FQN51_007843 [Onygenales sp. PD_10]